MPYIAQYLLKLSISLAVVYLFYAWVLRRLTFYTWNRWYLLGYSLLAFFIPFINISSMLEQGAWNENEVVQLIPVVGNYEVVETASNQLTGWGVSLFLLVAGIIIMLIRLLVQYCSFRHIRRTAQLISDDAVKIYQVDKCIIPFSFGRSIFINQHQHNEEELKEIIRHEFIHVKQRHTADILWSELLCMLNWYNPFVWLIRQSIRQNLEFIADHQVLKTGLDRKQYQYLLLKVVGAPAFAIASQFNFSSLKKRIAMMNKMRSAKVHLIKFLFILPLVTVLLLAFRSVAIKKAVALTPENSHTAVVQTAAPVLKDTVPTPKKRVNTLIDSIRSVTITARYDSDSGRYFVDASLNGPGNPYRAVPRNVLYIIDGVEQEKGTEPLKHTDPNEIVTISVLKDKSAETLYGEKAKDGVILVTTKKGVPAPQPVPPPANLPPVQDTVRPHIIIRDANDSHLSRFPGVVELDGVILDSQDVRNLNLKVKPEDIQSIDVLKGPGAEVIYGPKGKGGVIKITSKKRDPRTTGEPAPGQPKALTVARATVTPPPVQVEGKPFIIDARQEANEPF